MKENFTIVSSLSEHITNKGTIPKKGYENRTLSHFKENDKSLKSKGFIKSSFKDGLEPTEYFFNSMSCRDDLLNKTEYVKKYGYMQRRLINALEDLMVFEDGSVRKADGTIVQFDYGEDGISPMKSESGNAINLDEIIKNYKAKKDTDGKRKSLKPNNGDEEIDEKDKKFEDILLKKIDEARRKIALENNIEPQLLLDKETIRGLVKIKPNNRDEFLDVEKINEKVFELCGRVVLKIINSRG